MRGVLIVAAGLAVSGAVALGAGPAADAAPSLTWRVVQTRCVGGVVHLDVAITGGVVGQSYAIYGTSGLRASNENVIARSSSFTATFTPNEAYGNNDAAHFSVTGDVEAPVIGQQSAVRTISASCAPVSRPPATVPTTLSTSLGFDANALAPRAERHASAHTGRTVLIVVLVLLALSVGALLWWRRIRAHRG